MTDLNDLSFDELVPSQSKYLAKGDVGEDGMILTVRGFRQEIVKGDDGDEEKIVLYFAEDMKPMILNRTNAALLGLQLISVEGYLSWGALTRRRY